MKKVFIVFGVIMLILAAAVYIDYFIAETNKTLPKLVIKKELNNNSYVYNGVLYRVWYCKTNNTYTYGSYFDKEAICQSEYVYKSDYYTNSLGIKISQKEIELLTFNNIYTQEMIENINSEKELENALHVAYEYGRKDYVLAKDVEGFELKSTDGNKLIIFPEFELIDEEYKWSTEITEESKYYCFKTKNNIKYYAPYENELCGEFIELKMDEKWCENVKNSMLIYEEQTIKKLCEE